MDLDDGPTRAPMTVYKGNGELERLAKLAAERYSDEADKEIQWDGDDATYNAMPQERVPLLSFIQQTHGKPGPKNIVLSARKAGGQPTLYNHLYYVALEEGAISLLPKFTTSKDSEPVVLWRLDKFDRSNYLQSLLVFQSTSADLDYLQKYEKSERARPPSDRYTDEHKIVKFVVMPGVPLIPTIFEREGVFNKDEAEVIIPPYTHACYALRDRDENGYPVVVVTPKEEDSCNIL